MARRIRDCNLESRDGRSKLKVSGKPYWRAIGLGLHVGYRKGARVGKWVVRRYIGDQNYQVETIAIADDHIDADGIEVLNFWQAQERARGLRDPRPDACTVAHAIAAYLEHLDGRSSYRDARSRLEAHVVPVLGAKLVSDLTADDLRQWHRRLAKQQARVRTGANASTRNYRATEGEEGERKRRATANNCLKHFKAALNFARAEGKVKCDRSWARVKAFEGVHIPRSRYLSIGECQRLLNACEPDFRIIVRAALETGARHQELARLRVADFNPDSGTLHIRKSKASKDRHVILSEDGAALFAGSAAGRRGSDLLLGREWRPGLQARRMAVACERARIDPPITFHGLRHTWASQAVMGGMPLAVVAASLGHADTRMVERTYAHLSAGYVVEQVRKYAPRFGPVGKNNVTPMK